MNTDPNKSTYAFTAYSIGSTFLDKIGQIAGSTPEVIVLQRLRTLPLPKLMGTLLRMKPGRLYIVSETEEATALMPVVLLCALLTRARQMFAISADLQPRRIGFWDVVRAIAGLLRGNWAGRLSQSRRYRHVRQLLRETRIAPVFHDSRSVVFLNANMWFGVQSGGSVGHIAGVLNGLSGLGYDVSYAALVDNKLTRPSVARLLLPRLRHFGYPFEVNHGPSQELIVPHLAAKIPAQCRFIYQRMSVLDYSGVVLSRQLGVPLIIEYNGSEAWIARNWGRALRNHQLAVLIEQVCLAHAHLVVTVSDVLRDELIARGVEPARIVCYPNCIDPSLFDPARFTDAETDDLRARHRIPANAVVATFMGTFGMWHGVDVLAAAIRRMIDTERSWLLRTGMHFLLVGDGLKMPDVLAHIGDESCREFVTLTGLVRQDQAPLYLAASDVLLSPHVRNPDGSRFFGSPTKLYEYMAMGKSIVASDLEQLGATLSPALKARAIPECGPGPGTQDVAVLCEPGSVEDLIAAIRFLAESPGWRKALGTNARRTALSRYTWQHHVGAILEGLDRVAAKTTEGSAELEACEFQPR